MKTLEELLNQSAALHRHLCPRQVLGVRMGLAGSSLLGVSSPNPDKRLLVILETDGCFADGIEAATDCSIGHRTLRVEDYGKVAATFIDLETAHAVRLAPKPDVRQRALYHAPDQERRYFAQLHGYQLMPVNELFVVQSVALTKGLERIVSHPGIRTNCVLCGEEIINEREVRLNGLVLCRPCSGDAYYQVLEAAPPTPVWNNLQTNQVQLN
jgi:formylmethanofuran dehydrogenase subunit E